MLLDNFDTSSTYYLRYAISQTENEEWECVMTNGEWGMRNGNEEWEWVMTNEEWGMRNGEGGMGITK